MRGIKKVHEHEGAKVCYAIDPRLTEPGLMYADKRYWAVGYLPHTGRWYVYDPETGKEVASITGDFYDHFLRFNRVGDLVVDPECVR